jgi:TolB-like protein/Flp pilus assembly protein TadD
MEGRGQLRPDLPGAATEQLGRRLDSWKEIAAYLGRSEKTVQRWEEKEDLPVHRLVHEKRGSVYAYTSELDVWRDRRKTANESALVDESRPPILEIPKRRIKDKRLARPPALLLIGLIVLLSIIGLGLFSWHRLGTESRTGGGERIHSLAVLPLENLSGDTGQEYFADGMTAELITELAKIGSLRVISRTSAMRYKRSPKSLPEIARALRVDAVVEGEVLKTERRVRINAQLIEAATDRHIWAETYERDLRDAVELQGEVVESIATAIRAKVTPQEHARLSPKHAVNPEAYDAYLKGRFFWNKRTESGLKKSIEYFQYAIGKDPGYALAYAALADSYEIVGSPDLPPVKGTYLKAEAAARKALELDGSLGEAHTVLADVRYALNRDWTGAEREFKRAIELSPGYATAYQRYSTFLSKMGRHEESLRAIHKAQTLDPLSPAINGGVGSRLLWAHHYDDAIEELQRALEMDPNLGLTHRYLAWAQQAKGNPEKALNHLRQAVLLDSRTGLLAALAHGYALAGHAPQARSILKHLEERSRRGYVPPYEIAVVYAGLRQKDRAFQWLARSCQDQDVEFVSLKIDPDLDSLRSDPRFQNLLRCAGLAQ